jgi:hypothetical protein
MKELKIFTNNKNTTLAYIGYYELTNQIIIAFRGSKNFKLLFYLLCIIWKKLIIIFEEIFNNNIY